MAAISRSIRLLETFLSLPMGAVHQATQILKFSGFPVKVFFLTFSKIENKIIKRTVNLLRMYGSKPQAWSKITPSKAFKSISRHIRNLDENMLIE